MYDFAPDRVKRHVKSNPLLFAAVSGSFRVAHRTSGHLEHGCNRITQRAPIDPFRLIHIRPSDVEYRLSSSFTRKSKILSKYSPVLCGDWDLERAPLSEYRLFYSICHHFEEGVPWEETDWYAKVKAEIESGELGLGHKWGSKTVDEFGVRCARLDELYEQIKSDGYKLQREVRGSDTDPIEYDRSSRQVYIYPPVLHEVTVHIGRNGDFLFHDGRNRFSIAYALGLKSIPVRVMVRHAEWQETRDEVASAKSIDQLDTDTRQYLAHPDMRKIRPDTA